MPHPPDEFDQLPPALIARLRQAEHPPAVPTGIDEAIIRTSQLWLRRGRHALTLRHYAELATALAATIAICAYISFAPSRAPSPHQFADIDRSGTVDILDAFRLARALDAGSPAAGPDLNHDGRVDHADAHAIARQAVRLTPTPTHRNGGAG